MENKKPWGKQTSGTHKQYPRYPPNYLKRDRFTLQQALSLNAGTRDVLLREIPFHTADSGIRSPSPFSPVHTIHRLSGRISEKANFPSKSFGILLTFKHKLTGLSTDFSFSAKIFCARTKNIWLLDADMVECIQYWNGFDEDGQISRSFRELAAGVSQCEAF